LRDDARGDGAAGRAGLAAFARGFRAGSPAAAADAIAAAAPLPAALARGPDLALTTATRRDRAAGF
jgi:hypothetical protein